MFSALIVEDRDDFRRRLRRMLLQCCPQAEVFEAADAATALRLLQSHCPEVVLLDIHLPDLSGLAILPRIKHDLPHSRIVVLTVLDLPEYREAALEAGASHFLSKHDLSEAALASILGSLPN